MTAPAERPAVSRKAQLAKKRQSRRPSRQGALAGAAVKPDRVREDDAGFPGLLKRTWQLASDTPDLREAVHVLLSLSGYVPADVQLRALRSADEAALKVLCGLSWREEEAATAAAYANRARGRRRLAGQPTADGEPPSFLGEIGLTTAGRVVVRVPSQPPLAKTTDLVDGVMRVAWSAHDLADFQHELARSRTRFAQSVADCRQWLGDLGSAGRDELLEGLKEAAIRTAPFVLYQEDKQYTNFRDRNTVVGKTLWSGHPDCALSSLQRLPLELWSDHDAVMATCLTLLIRSAGYARIEEANNTQLSLDHVAHQLERNRRTYNRCAAPGSSIPAVSGPRVAALDGLARGLRQLRGEIGGQVQLYREIHGALIHKIERIAAPYGAVARRREDAVCARLSERLPFNGATLAELGAAVAADPEWLARPHRGAVTAGGERASFATGLEALVYEAVAAATEAFETDFSMSRGLRSLPQLIRSLREEDFQEIADWGITDFFCCVVPSAEARRHFSHSTSHLADTAWAMSSRMQYNSWHFIAGNLPKGPAIEQRDYFVPPTIPDIAFYSDQHHHGHIAAKVRFSIRSPQAVQILGRPFFGFMDLRLLRCEGLPFDEQDMLAAHRVSGFIAEATSLAAELAAEGREVDVTAFDSAWHLETVTAQVAARFGSEGEETL
ncbi:hypothetical protein [Streptomyces sp. NPDC006879]|uniref:hypothetical protein n=1 Tax=Streptomyces sp. NPDC006879 TaxID=3364767 RepID=UPI0036A719E5